MPVSSSVQALATALKLPAASLEAFAVLDAAKHTRLLKLLDEAKAKQRAALEAGIDGALSHIPFLLRGPISKLLKGFCRDTHRNSTDLCENSLSSDA